MPNYFDQAYDEAYPEEVREEQRRQQEVESREGGVGRVGSSGDPFADSLSSFNRPISKESLSTGYHFLLPAAGAAIGGTASGPFAPLVAGAGGMLGDQAADYLDEFTGVKPRTATSGWDQGRFVDWDQGFGLTDRSKQMAKEFVLGALTDTITRAAPSAWRGANSLLGRPVTADQIIDNAIYKGIAPTVVGQRNAPKMAEYASHARTAVKDIAENKSTLKLKDELGRVVEGEAPKTVNQFLQAIDQRKRSVFKQYNDLVSKAGGQNVSIDLNPVADELEAFALEPRILAFKSDLAKKAMAKAKDLRKQGSLTLDQAQDAIADLNSELSSFYRNPEYGKATEAGMDSLAVKKLRAQMDDTIAHLTGEDYQKLKNLYGSLSHIEEDVARRAVVTDRAKPHGVFDFFDISSAADLASAFAHMDPALFAKAVVKKSLKERFVGENNPNNIIKGMFEGVEGEMANAGRDWWKGMPGWDAALGGAYGEGEKRKVHGSREVSGKLPPPPPPPPPQSDGNEGLWPADMMEEWRKRKATTPTPTPTPTTLPTTPTTPTPGPDDSRTRSTPPNTPVQPFPATTPDLASTRSQTPYPEGASPGAEYISAFKSNWDNMVARHNAAIESNNPLDSPFMFDAAPVGSVKSVGKSLGKSALSDSILGYNAAGKPVYQHAIDAAQVAALKGEAFDKEAVTIISSTPPKTRKWGKSKTTPNTEG